MTQPSESHLPRTVEPTPGENQPICCPAVGAGTNAAGRAASTSTTRPNIRSSPAHNPQGTAPTPLHHTPTTRNQRPGETTVLDRMSLLGELHDDNSQPAFGRNRNIAGSLPDWSPQPPGEILINRRRP